MTINSRQKGKRVELAAAHYLTGLGFTARRGQQFAGGADSPDVIVDELPDIHFEVKGDRSIDLGNKAWYDAIIQAARDAGPKTPVVLWWVHRRGWRLTTCGVTTATYVGDGAIAYVLRMLQSLE